MLIIEIKTKINADNIAMLIPPIVDRHNSYILDQLRPIFYMFNISTLSITKDSQPRKNQKIIHIGMIKMVKLNFLD